VSGTALRLGRLRREWAPGMAGLLRAANVTGRVAVLTVLGFFIFKAWRPGTADAAVQIAAFAVAAVVVIWYSAIEGWAGSRRRDVLLMSCGLGTVAVTCGAASMTPRGSPRQGPPAVTSQPCTLSAAGHLPPVLAIRSGVAALEQVGGCG
jgi:hypothetical protein